MGDKPKSNQTDFEKAAREAGEGRPFDDVLRHLVKPEQKRKGGTPKKRRPKQDKH